MSRRRGCLAALAAALVAAAALGAWLWLCPWTATALEYRYRYRLRGGMTLGEVEAVLGEGEYRPRGISQRRGQWGDGHWTEIVVEGDTEFYLWKQGEMEVWVGFLDGRLVHKWFHAPAEGTDHLPALLDLLRR